MADIKLNEQTNSLLEQVNKLYPGPVIIRFEDEKKGYIRHDQSKQEVLPDGLVITVTDITAPDYTASHELLHLLLLLRGFPQVFFDVSFGDAQLDEQLMIMATDLYDVAMHLVVVSEQRKHGLIDETIEQEYVTGIEATLTPETDQPDNERTLRLLTLTDALVFLGDNLPKYEQRLRDLYPLAFPAAQKLFAELTAKQIDSPFAMRRTIVKLFKNFDDQLASWGLPPLHNTEFTTLSSVFSERQLRLEVRQLFEIFHSEMTDRQTGEPAYIGLNKIDRQNSFIIAAPKDQDSAEFFKAAYDKTVQELFNELKMPFILRE